MYIKINAKGIKETLGTGKRFQALLKKLKQYKIVTLRHLKQIIEQAELIVDNVGIRIPVNKKILGMRKYFRGENSYRVQYLCLKYYI